MAGTSDINIDIVEKDVVSLDINSTVTPQDASETVKGIMKLTGDLGGTAESPTVPGLAIKEPTITVGNTNQYYRGDKTWQTLDKAAVGLNNVDNTSDSDKPVSTATQVAINAKVADSIIDGITSIAPSQNAVFDALGNKVSKGDLVINVKDYGAKGDGVTNDTDAFKAASQAITDANGGTLFIPPGEYIVGKQTFAGATGLGYAYRASDIIKISECTNPVTILASGAKIKVEDGLKFGSFNPTTGAVHNPTMPFYNADYASHIGNVINLINNHIVDIIGGLEIDGNIANASLGGTWGDTGRQLIAYGVRVVGSRLLTISNVHTHHHCLDGLYIGQYSGYDGVEVRPFTLINVVSEYNARQGFSLAGGNGGTVIGGSFSFTGKSTFSSAPKAGLDIEAELGLVRNIHFYGTQFIDCTGVAMVADSGDIADVSFTDCKFANYSTYALWPKKPRMQFNNCKIAGGVVNAYGSATSPQDSTKFTDCKFTDEVAKQVAQWALFV